MDKKFLLRVNDSMKRIKTNLLLNDKIRQLLYYDEINHIFILNKENSLTFSSFKTTSFDKFSSSI